jgi:hypothetical protein
MVQSNIEAGDLLNASHFVFHAWQSTALHCMRLTEHVTINFNDNMSVVAIFLDIEEAFDTTWHSGLLYKLHKLKYLTD